MFVYLRKKKLAQIVVAASGPATALSLVFTGELPFDNNHRTDATTVKSIVYSIVFGI